MRTISSFKFVGELLPPRNWFPTVGLGNMPAVRRAVELPSRNGSLLALRGWKIGWVEATVGTALLALLESALHDGPLAVITGVLKVSPAFVNRVCCAGES